MFSKTDSYEKVLNSFGLSKQNLTEKFIVSEYIKSYLETGISPFKFITEKLPLYPSIKLTAENGIDLLRLDDADYIIRYMIDMLTIAPDSEWRDNNSSIIGVGLKIDPLNQNKTIIEPGLNLTQPTDIDKLKGGQFEAILQSQGYQLYDFLKPEFVAQNPFLQQMQAVVDETIIENRQLIMAMTLEKDTYKMLRHDFYITGTLLSINPDSNIYGISSVEIKEPIRINDESSDISWSIVTNDNEISYSPNEITSEKPKSHKIRGHQLVLELN